MSMPFYLLHKGFRFKYRNIVRQLKEINSEVSQGNVLGPMLYLLHATDLIALNPKSASHADDIAIFMFIKEKSNKKLCRLFLKK